MNSRKLKILFFVNLIAIQNGAIISNAPLWSASESPKNQNKEQAKEGPDHARLEGIVKEMNKRLVQQGDLSGDKFDIKQYGDTGGYYILFKGSHSPSWAVKEWLENEGILTGYGTGGIDPFREYKHEEWISSALFIYYSKRGFPVDLWKRNHGVDAVFLGSQLLKEVKEDLGSSVFKDLQEASLKDMERRQTLDYIANQMIPMFTKAIYNKKTLSIFGISVLFLLVVPLAAWNFTKAAARFIFARRPVVLGDKDTDIYKSLFRRLFGKKLKLPNVIVNKKLNAKLQGLIAENKLILAKNKKKPTSPTPYTHVLAYGKPGLGKTLFAKKLAQMSGMHFMYMSVSDLAQLSEEEALSTMKDFFRYARRHYPCILIVDEADLLFNSKDYKSDKLRVLFQKEFPNANDPCIQLFIITNYPERFFEAFQGRLGKKLKFTKPTSQPRSVFLANI